MWLPVASRPARPVILRGARDAAGLAGFAFGQAQPRPGRRPHPNGPSNPTRLRAGDLVHAGVDTAIQVVDEAPILDPRLVQDLVVRRLGATNLDTSRCRCELPLFPDVEDILKLCLFAVLVAKLFEPVVTDAQRP